VHVELAQGIARGQPRSWWRPEVRVRHPGIKYETGLAVLALHEEYTCGGADGTGHLQNPVVNQLAQELAVQEATPLQHGVHGLSWPNLLQQFLDLDLIT
jgi:hypothetical protein